MERIWVGIALVATLSACKVESGAASAKAPEPVKDVVADPPIAIAPQPSHPGGEAYSPELASEIAKAVATLPSDYKPRTKHLDESGTARFTNRLIFERSPYLRQHAHNPVNWRPWGEEAFADAERLGKPVFLSIGYTTCHWCHVMEEESFEDLEIAEYLNQHYVCIKLDREERPDIDGVYMTAVNLLTGRGGWPMSVWLTPSREPFMAGTYFPPRDGDRGNRKGFLTLIRELSEEYATDGPRIADKAAQLARRVRNSSVRAAGNGLPARASLRRAVASYQRIFDADYGGFGRGNKFPRPSNLEFLLRMHRHLGDSATKTMLVKSLDAMRDGGLYDHVDDGFHRYTTERRFRIPHFEKMLYDNAQLVVAYLEAAQLLGDASYLEVAERTLDYVVRDMVGPEGGFYSATDADSEGEEGIFAIWTRPQIKAAVGEPSWSAVADYFNVTDRGNFEHGTTVLHVTKELEAFASERGVSPEEMTQILAAGKSKLFAARRLREQPILDDKMLTAWNGLMIGAFARGALVLNRSDYAAVAKRAAAFVREELWQNGRLKRRYHSGEARFDGVLDDYSYLIQGLLELYEAVGEEEWLDWAFELQRVVDSQFKSASGGYFMTAADGEALIAREKPDYDGARPSGNSVTVLNLLKMHAMTGDEGYRKRADGALQAFQYPLEKGSTAMPKMLCGLDFRMDRALQIVVSSPSPEGKEELLGALRKEFVPNRVLLYGKGEGAPSRNPLVSSGKIPLKGKPTAYVCEEGVCQQPVHTGDDLVQQIRKLKDVL